MTELSHIKYILCHRNWKPFEHQTRLLWAARQMAINFTVERNITSDLNQTKISAWPTSAVVSSALNIFLSITATLGNALILIAIHKESSLHPPTKLLFRCLAVTDLCVGLISEPITAISILRAQTNAMNWKILDYVDDLDNVTSYLLCGVSIFTSKSISVDRLLALLLGLRYRHVVTLRQVRAVVICFWLIGAFCGSMHFLN